MDKSCKDGKQNWGVACVIRHYPSLAGNKVAGVIGDLFGADVGGCPAADACVSQLKACAMGAGGRCPGSDHADCSNPSCLTCYQQADRCVARAAKDCEAKAKCGDKKCEKNKGETTETCCTDCGCEGELVCEDGNCVKETQQQTPSPGETSYDLLDVCLFGIMLPLMMSIATLTASVFEKIL